MGSGTGIGRVRGLGSAKHGAGHFITQRVSEKISYIKQLAAQAERELGLKADSAPTVFVLWPNSLSAHEETTTWPRSLPPSPAPCCSTAPTTSTS